MTRKLVVKVTKQLPLFGHVTLPNNPFADSAFPPGDQERRVAALIWQYRGRENPVSLADLCKVTSLHEREIKGVVERLRVDHGIPIGARRRKPFGYFIVVDAEDARLAVEPYAKQIFSMLRVLRVFTKRYRRIWVEFAGQLRIEVTEE